MDDWDRQHVHFEACFNFRDLGGYGTRDGREVRRGLLYRADSLHRLSTDDLARLARLGIRTVIDLRSATELARYGRVPRHGDRTSRHVPFEEAADGSHLRPRADQYLAIALSRGDRLALALQLLTDEDGPVVFHCMGGKDRTGILAALLLAVLGVPDQTIGADYTLTERSLDRAFAWASEHDPDWAAWQTRVAPSGLLGAPTDVMVEFLQRLRAKFGTVEQYLVDVGLAETTLHRLRDRYLA